MTATAIMTPAERDHACAHAYHVAIGAYQRVIALVQDAPKGIRYNAPYWEVVNASRMEADDLWEAYREARYGYRK